VEVVEEEIDWCFISSRVVVHRTLSFSIAACYHWWSYEDGDDDDERSGGADNTFGDSIDQQVVIVLVGVLRLEVAVGVMVLLGLCVMVISDCWWWP